MILISKPTNYDFIQVIHVLHLHFNHASAQNNEINLFLEGESLTSYTEKHASSGGEGLGGGGRCRVN